MDCHRPTAPRPLPPAHSRSAAFTLTELLIVIAIIAVLAALITAAAVNALRAANRGKIVLAIQGVSRGIEDFKNDYGAYPPNAMNPQRDHATTGTRGQLAVADVQRMFKQAFPRHNEPGVLIAALAGAGPTSGGPNLDQGLNAAEAPYFWLGGFSEDEQYPISGPGGPSFSDADGDGDGTLELSDEVLENRNQRYEFDLALLGPRNSDGTFNGGSNPGQGRFIVYDFGGVQRRINFWQYRPKNSTQPLVYFDVSRHKPGALSGMYDAWAANPTQSGLPLVFAFKKKRSGVTTVTDFSHLSFVNEGKFQLLHPGLDDAWGNFAEAGSYRSGSPKNANEVAPLFPDGPFIGEVADTLTNFTDGTLEDAAK